MMSLVIFLFIMCGIAFVKYKIDKNKDVKCNSKLH